MKCWNCGALQEDPSWGKLPFRAVCDKCHAALHCCQNCIHHKIRLPNECNVPNTDFISDRTASNFCEEFDLLGKQIDSKSDVLRASKRLFGDDSSEIKNKKDFNSLFEEDKK